MSQYWGQGHPCSNILQVRRFNVKRFAHSNTGLSYLLPHFDEEELPRKVEENIGVVGVISNVRDGNVKRDVPHCSQSQVGCPVINTMGKNNYISLIFSSSHNLFTDLFTQLLPPTEGSQYNCDQ